MTMREFYQNVLNTCGTTVSPWGEDEEQIVNICHKQIAALDARNEKRKSTESKEKKEAAERRNTVLAFLADHKGESFTRDRISFETDLDPAKVTGACTALVKEGSVIKTEIKVEKSRKVAYSIA